VANKTHKHGQIDESTSSVAVNRVAFRRLLADAAGQSDTESLRALVSQLKQTVTSSNGRRSPLLAEVLDDPDAVLLKRDVLSAELDQILEAQTIERARYYLKRLQRGVEKTKTALVNDINLHRWKEYPEIITDSLWSLPKRDTAGAHLGWYWGNFVPQIPHQLMLRYTKTGEWVLDPFLGSGTTLIECRRLGRNGLGVELNANVAGKASELIDRERNRFSVSTSIVVGDSRSADLKSELARAGTASVQLLIMHPPYHDIIAFSDHEADLSNANSVERFLEMLGAVVDNTTPLLDRGRYFGLVIGDKYQGGEWVPLGFMCMNEVLKRGYSLKSLIVKNFDETRAKRDQKQLWRYRALVGGFYIFKHEYIFLFRKK